VTRERSHADELHVTVTMNTEVFLVGCERVQMELSCGQGDALTGLVVLFGKFFSASGSTSRSRTQLWSARPASESMVSSLLLGKTLCSRVSCTTSLDCACFRGMPDTVVWPALVGRRVVSSDRLRVCVGEGVGAHSLKPTTPRSRLGGVGVSRKSVKPPGKEFETRGHKLRKLTRLHRSVYTRQHTAAIARPGRANLHRSP
jgi:hypothetical protein